jgi:alpha-galactosidase
MPKITFIGAGSTVFAKTLMGDILTYPEFADCTLCLFDIDSERLKASEIVANRIAQVLNVKPKIVVTTDRERALEGADYAITMIQVGGYKPSTVIDFEIPKKYGLQQTIADTLGIGGIMRALRTIPVLLEYSRTMEQLCPDVWHLNYVNPMAMNVMGLTRGSSIRTVGLCHSVQGTAHQLAHDLGIPEDEINYICAGINHMAFYLKLEHHGQDMYPRLREVAKERTPERFMDMGFGQGWNISDAVRYEMFKRLGYFVTESSEHFSEYTPWFIKQHRPDLIEKFGVPLNEYPRRCEVQIENWNAIQEFLEKPDSPLEVKRSHEYGSRIIHSLHSGEPRVVYSNVLNNGLIDNLPDHTCVEVPCLVDNNGIQPTRIGAIPPHLSALMQTNINVQHLTVEAILTGNREHIYHAAMLDPHTAAELDLEQIWSLVDELLAAHGNWIPEALRA